MKNTLSFGTDRGLLFFTKWISSVLLGLILTAAVFGVYFGSSAMLFQHDSAFSQELMGQFLNRLGVACLIYIASVTMSLFFLVLFSRNTLAIFLYYGVFYLTELLLKLFRLETVVPYLLKSQLMSIVQGPNVLMQQPILSIPCNNGRVFRSWFGCFLQERLHLTNFSLSYMKGHPEVTLCHGI